MEKQEWTPAAKFNALMKDCKRTGLSRRRIARLLGVSNNKLYLIESGRTVKIQTGIYKKLLACYQEGLKNAPRDPLDELNKILTNYILSKRGA